MNVQALYFAHPLEDESRTDPDQYLVPPTPILLQGQAAKTLPIKLPTIQNPSSSILFLLVLSIHLRIAWKANRNPRQSPGKINLWPSHSPVRLSPVLPRL